MLNDLANSVNRYPCQPTSRRGLASESRLDGVLTSERGSSRRAFEDERRRTDSTTCGRHPPCQMTHVIRVYDHLEQPNSGLYQDVGRIQVETHQKSANPGNENFVGRIRVCILKCTEFGCEFRNGGNVGTDPMYQLQL